jgi:hypothetical protein
VFCVFVLLWVLFPPPPHVDRCFLSPFVPFYGPLPPERDAIAVNKCHIISNSDNRKITRAVSTFSLVSSYAMTNEAVELRKENLFRRSNAEIIVMQS